MTRPPLSGLTALSAPGLSDKDLSTGPLLSRAVISENKKVFSDKSKQTTAHETNMQNYETLHSSLNGQFTQICMGVKADPLQGGCKFRITS